MSAVSLGGGQSGVLDVATSRRVTGTTAVERGATHQFRVYFQGRRDFDASDVRDALRQLHTLGRQLLCVEMAVMATTLGAGIRGGPRRCADRSGGQHRQQALGGDTPSVVTYRNGIVGIDEDINISAISCEGFVNGVVYHLVNEVMKSFEPCIADVHGRTFPDGLKSFQDLDAIG